MLRDLFACTWELWNAFRLCRLQCNDKPLYSQIQILTKVLEISLHLDCLLNRLFGCRWKKHQIPRHWSLWGDSVGHRWFPSQRPSNAENVSIWWRHRVLWLQMYHLATGHNRTPWTPIGHNNIQKLSIIQRMLLLSIQKKLAEGRRFRTYI